VTNRGLGIWTRRFQEGRGSPSPRRLRSKGNGWKTTLPMVRIRKKLSALVLWCAFLGLYLGGAVMLAIGVFFASREWWATIHRHAGPWEIGTKTAEFLILALGLILVLVVPVVEHKSVDGSGAWKTGRRSELKSRASAPEKDCLITR